MEGELAKLDGLEVVHDGEYTLFHLAGVLGTQNNHFHTLKVDFDGGCGRHALGEAIGRELAGIVNDKVRLAKVCELFLGGTDEHVILRMMRI